MVYMFDKWDLPTVKENQVMVVNIHWNTRSTIHYRSKAYSYDTIPESVVLDLPTNIYQMKKGPAQDDAIESYVYSHLSNFFNHEIFSCQIYKHCKEDSWVNYDDFDGPGSHQLLEQPSFDSYYSTGYDSDYYEDDVEEDYMN